MFARQKLPPRSSHTDPWALENALDDPETEKLKERNSLYKEGSANPMFNSNVILVAVGP